MLKINNLKAGYGDLEILHGIDLNVEKGEVAVIIGPNGAGKSTVLKSIFNLCDVYSGNIFYDNRDITKLPTQNIIYWGINYVPQGGAVFSDMTVKENLEMGGYILKDKESLKRNVGFVLSKFSFLKKKLTQRAFTLSGGQQQLLAMARALVFDTKLLLLDEPSLGLAPKATEEIFDKINDINKSGVTIIIVEQNIIQAIKTANKVHVLENGKIVMTGDNKILKDKKLQNIYFGD